MGDLSASPRPAATSSGIVSARLASFAPATAMCSLTPSHLRGRNPWVIVLSPIFRLEPRIKSLSYLSQPLPRAFSTPITPFKVP